MKSKANFFRGFILAVLAQPWVAEAHPFHWATESMGFAGGLLHPLTSLEHLLTMLAVGLCLSQAGSRLAYMLSLSFVMLMLTGVGLAQYSVEIPHIDILLSSAVLLLLLALVLGSKFPPYLGMTTVSALAVLHGYQHADAIWLDTGSMAYTEGFTLATWILLAVGMGVGRLFKWVIVKYSLGKIAERLSCSGFYHDPTSYKE